MAVLSTAVGNARAAARFAVFAGPGRVARFNWNNKLPTGTDRVHLYHVRKTAGTSLYNAFLALGGEPPQDVLRRTTSARPGVTYSGGYIYAIAPTRWYSALPIFFSHSHAPTWQLNLPPKTYTVTILRDPLSRALSLYRYLCEPGSDASEVLPAPPGEREWTRGGLAAFARTAPPAHLLCQLAMFSKTLNEAEAAENIRNCRCWFFTESYSVGLSTLARQLSLSLESRRDRPSRPLAADLDPGELSELRELLEPEYRMLRELSREPGPGFVGAFPPTCQ